VVCRIISSPLALLTISSLGARLSRLISPDRASTSTVDLSSCLVVVVSEADQASTVCYVHPLASVALPLTKVVVMMYTRASASDYDDWEAVYGNHGWGSKDLIPLLKKVWAPRKNC
jgi:hypothetical protein